MACPESVRCREPRAYLLVAHGSRDPQLQSTLGKLAASVAEILPASESWVETATLDLGPTPLQDQIVAFGRRAEAVGHRRCQIVPLFLLPGIHVQEDIPAAVAIARQQLASHIVLNLCPYLGSHPGLPSLVAKSFDPCRATTWILLAHGSRYPGGNKPVETIAQHWQAHLAYWAVSPKLPEQAQALVEAGHQSIGVVPYFLFSGYITLAIAQMIAELKQQFANVHFELAPPLEVSRALAQLVVDLT